MWNVGYCIVGQCNQNWSAVQIIFAVHLNEQPEGRSTVLPGLLPQQPAIFCPVDTVMENPSQAIHGLTDASCPVQIDT